MNSLKQVIDALEADKNKTDSNKTDSNKTDNHALSTSEDEDDAGVHRGVSRLWSSVNHIAIVVEDVGRSLQFYTDVVGMKQIMRPNFDR